MDYPHHDEISKDYPVLPDKENKLKIWKLVAFISVARVRPRTSKGITDLLLPQTSMCYTHIVPLRSTRLKIRKFSVLFSRLRSRSLTELTRQFKPPTKNGHAPPPIKSRKSSQSVNPSHVWTWWVSPCWVKLSRRLHSWWCPSVNSFKFQPCAAMPSTLMEDSTIS